MSTTIARARLLLLLGAALAAGCGAPAATPRGTAHGAEAAGAQDGAWRERSTGCGASASMPAPVREEHSWEGPTEARVAWGVDADGSRYEIACFKLPEALDAAGREELLARIERYITLRPGARSADRRSASAGGIPAAELHLTLADAHAGRYWIFFVGDQRLFEVSVVGPTGARLAAGAERFFQSFRVAPPAPPRDP